MTASTCPPASLLLIAGLGPKGEIPGPACSDVGKRRVLIRKLSTGCSTWPTSKALLRVRLLPDTTAPNRAWPGPARVALCRSVGPSGGVAVPAQVRSRRARMLAPPCGHHQRLEEVTDDAPGLTMFRRWGVKRRCTCSSEAIASHAPDADVVVLRRREAMDRWRSVAGGSGVRGQAGRQAEARLSRRAASFSVSDRSGWPTACCFFVSKARNQTPAAHAVSRSSLLNRRPLAD
jgi:hypothetical protein